MLGEFGSNSKNYKCTLGTLQSVLSRLVDVIIISPSGWLLLKYADPNSSKAGCTVVIVGFFSLARERRLRYKGALSGGRIPPRWLQPAPAPAC